jgi:DNA-binding beta-propeller fold protein YncE
MLSDCRGCCRGSSCAALLLAAAAGPAEPITSAGLKRSGATLCAKSKRAISRVILIIAALLVQISYAGQDGVRTSEGPVRAVQEQERHSGWLYVVDSDDWFNSKVLAVDPIEGKVMRTYAAGYRPDIALSPDGDRLYIALTLENAGNKGSVLDIYDTASGKLTERIPNPDPFQSTVPVYPRRLSMSASGRYLYVIRSHNTRETTDVYLTVFDTANDKFLPTHLSLFGCNPTLLPTDKDLIVDLACANSPYVREVTIRYSDEATTERILGSEQVLSYRWGAVFVTPDKGEIGLIGNNGSRFALSRALGVFRHAGEVEQHGQMLGQQAAVVDVNRGEVFWGNAQEKRDWSERYDEIVSVNAATLTGSNRSPTMLPFYSMVLSADGDTLYAVSPTHAVILAVDASTLRELKRFSVGKRPIFALAAPQ